MLSYVVRQTLTIITLDNVLSLLAKDELLSRLSALRQNLIHNFIESALKQPRSVEVTSGPDEHGTPTITFSLYPSSIGDPSYMPPFEYLSTLLNHLSENLFQALPPSEQKSFPSSLGLPITKATLERVLEPSIPNSSKSIPEFLDLVAEAIGFENDYILGSLDAGGEREVRVWAENVGKHYSRKRRNDILQAARALIMDRSVAVEGELSYVELVDTSADPLKDEEEKVVEQRKDDVDADAWELEDEQVDAENASASTSKETNASVAQTQSSEAQNEEVVDDDTADAWDLDDEEPT